MGMAEVWVGISDHSLSATALFLICFSLLFAFYLSCEVVFLLDLLPELGIDTPRLTFLTLYIRIATLKTFFNLDIIVVLSYCLFVVVLPGPNHEKYPQLSAPYDMRKLWPLPAQHFSAFGGTMDYDQSSSHTWTQRLSVPYVLQPQNAVSLRLQLFSPEPA